VAVAVALALALVAPAPAAPRAPQRSAEHFSHAALDTVLARFVHAGRVDYGGLLRDHATLDRYLAAIAIARPETWSLDEQIAFWVDAYDARVLDGVIRRPGLKSVLDTTAAPGLPPFFAERRPTGGEPRSLDEIEKRILRPRFGEPRIHFVLNCASVSCPELPARALTGATLEADLEAATRRFLDDPSRNRIEPGRGMWLSAIFTWYADDFIAESGSVRAFIEAHRPGRGRLKPDLPAHELPYDWSLNGGW
jgi:uncharacterized protein DUF547